LLARSAKQGAASGTLIDNASTLVKRAMANHEHLIFEIVNQLTVPEDEPALVNVTNLIHDVLRFLRNEASSRDICISVTGGKDIQVSATLKLRTLLLGLLTLCIDGLPAGAELRIKCQPTADAGACSHVTRFALGLPPVSISPTQTRVIEDYEHRSKTGRMSNGGAGVPRYPVKPRPTKPADEMRLSSNKEKFE
jgi:hypothetical protein